MNSMNPMNQTNQMNQIEKDMKNLNIIDKPDASTKCSMCSNQETTYVRTSCLRCKCCYILCMNCFKAMEDGICCSGFGRMEVYF